MTILSVMQEACKVIGLDVPTAVLASTDREHIELVGTANDMAERIMQSYDWQTLKTLATFTGDGTTEDFAFPTGYNRMLKKAQVWSSSLETPLSPISDTDHWLGLDVQSFDFVVNAWTIYGDQFHIKPALASAVTAKFYYISNLIVAPAAGDNKTSFTADTDTFRLDETLLRHGIIWQWRANKGLPYQEDMESYESRKESLITHDKGARMIRIGTIRMPKGITTAYPQNITA